MTKADTAAVLDHMADVLTERCRCGHEYVQHTGAYGHPMACVGDCGCSFFEPLLPEPEPPKPAAPYATHATGVDVSWAAAWGGYFYTPTPEGDDE